MPTRKTVVENAGLGDVTAKAAQAPKNALRVTFIVALSAHCTGAIIALPGLSQDLTYERSGGIDELALSVSAVAMIPTAECVEAKRRRSCPIFDTLSADA